MKVVITWRVSALSLGRPARMVWVCEGGKQADQGSAVERARVRVVSLGARQVLRMAKWRRWVGRRSSSKVVTGGWSSSPTWDDRVRRSEGVTA